jgi:hypothetical protein
MLSTYLIQFGKPGFVGRFRPAEPRVFIRGDRVVIRGPRGFEFGSVLCEPDARFSGEEPEGDILRVASRDDEAAFESCSHVGRDILSLAEKLGAALPLAFVDVEVMLDRASAILHVIPWDACEADALFASLSERFSLPVRMLDLSRTPTVKDEPQPASGCGKPGCGSEKGGCSSCGTGGGCSTGSCSSGSVKSSGELTAYFSNLRKQMEDTSRTPLV